MAKYSIGLREYGSNGKTPKVEVFAADLTSGTFAAQMTAAGLFRSAVLAVQLGEQRVAAYSHIENAGNSVLPTDQHAQRENKWLISARETSGGLNAVTFTIPNADLLLVGLDGETMAAGAEHTALVNAIQAFVLSNDLVAVAVESIRFRGRTL